MRKAPSPAAVTVTPRPTSRTVAPPTGRPVAPSSTTPSMIPVVAVCARAGTPHTKMRPNAATSAVPDREGLNTNPPGAVAPVEQAMPSATACG